MYGSRRPWQWSCQCLSHIMGSNSYHGFHQAIVKDQEARSNEFLIFVSHSIILLVITAKCWKICKRIWRVEFFPGTQFHCISFLHIRYISMALFYFHTIVVWLVYVLSIRMPYNLYCLGTTGKPKIVAFSHSALIIQSLTKICSYWLQMQWCKRLTYLYLKWEIRSTF